MKHVPFPHLVTTPSRVSSRDADLGILTQNEPILGATTDLSGSQGARSNDKWAILRRRCETCPISASCDDTL
uniref:Uncharacterized protein n=1 Tax=Magnetococcus massalia (strain MO-1) TaxID=451514 RepID=A0A1S7LLC4_MAGMO|nr:protein of unknown function [Candidatus Magnetococcus massalia]CRH06907.1 protein of unknown function [Candidatus Magnetococcus massalia]